MPLPSICRPPSPFIAGILFDLAPAIGLSGCPRLRFIDRVGIRWIAPANDRTNKPRCDRK